MIIPDLSIVASAAATPGAGDPHILTTELDEVRSMTNIERKAVLDVGGPPNRDLPLDASPTG